MKCFGSYTKKLSRDLRDLCLIWPSLSSLGDIFCVSPLPSPLPAGEGVESMDVCGVTGGMLVGYVLKPFSWFRCYCVYSEIGVRHG